MSGSRIAVRMSAALLAIAAVCGARMEIALADSPVTVMPSFIHGPILHKHYDGVTDDLLTGGLGKSGLAIAASPPFADPLHPTAAELRTRAIHDNYRALVDTSSGGGYGTLYGPNVTADGTVTSSEGLIAGDEFIAFAGAASGRVNVTMMVQVPDGFDPANACIVTAPSSGSRGVYGAIGTAGEWGLKHGCAVAYTDKGTGTGAHDLQNHTVNLITGERESADVAGKESNFTAPLNNEKRAEFNAETPNRFAFKHAHSRQNPEKDWGQNVIDSIEFAFFVLNEKFGHPVGRGAFARVIGPENTIVIASSVSNGGGASVRAVEQDKKHLISGVAVSEPNVNPVFDSRFVIVQEGRDPVALHSRSLYDYTTLLNVFQGCADLAPTNAAAPLNLAPSAARCATLENLGLLTSATLDDQATEAQKIINDFGILPEQNIVQPSHWFLFVPQSIAVTYANAYGRLGVEENTCGYSFGATSGGNPAALSGTSETALFGTSNGIPPTGGVNLINNLAPNGAKEDRVSTPDQDLRGALCLRGLATGFDPASGQPLAGQTREAHERIQQGIAEIRASGDLRGVPTLIVVGRNDAILPPNHASRAYFGLNRLVEGARSNLRYYEVTNAQHLDVLNGLPGFNSRFIPLHRYFIQALDLMFDHLKNGTPLPPSQVVHTVPRGAGPPVPPITLANVPPISASPDPSALITFVDNEVRIPN